MGTSPQGNPGPSLSVMQTDGSPKTPVYLRAFLRECAFTRHRCHHPFLSLLLLMLRQEYSRVNWSLYPRCRRAVASVVQVHSREIAPSSMPAFGSLLPKFLAVYGSNGPGEATLSIRELNVSGIFQQSSERAEILVAFHPTTLTQSLFLQAKSLSLSGWPRTKSLFSSSRWITLQVL